MPSRKQLPEPIATLRRERAWPEGVPVPPAGAFRGNQLWTYDDEQLLRKHYPVYGSHYAARLLGRSRRATISKASLLGISESTGRAWTKTDDRFLKRHYPRWSLQELALRLGRTHNSIKTRLVKLGLTTPKSPEWSAAEIALLREHSHAMPRRELAALIGRSRGAINRKIDTLGLTHERKVFTPTTRELEFIRRNAGKLSFVEIGAKFGTNAETIRRLALGFGFRARPTTRPWTTKDDAMLRKLYGTMGRKEVAARMNRTWQAVAYRAWQLGVTREVTYVSEPRIWTAREDARLSSMVGRMSKPMIAQRLNRSTASIAGRMATLGLRTPRTTKHRRWTAHEDAYLKRNVGKKSRRKMAEHLGRTHVAVTEQLRKLGLGEETHYAIEPRPWSKADDKQLRMLSRMIRSIDEIARRMGRTRNAIVGRKKKLGLTQARSGKAKAG